MPVPWQCQCSQPSHGWVTLAACHQGGSKLRFCQTTPSPSGASWLELIPSPMPCLQVPGSERDSSWENTLILNVGKFRSLWETWTLRGSC